MSVDMIRLTSDSEPTLADVAAELARMEAWAAGQFLVLPESTEGQYIDALRRAKLRLEAKVANEPPPLIDAKLSAFAAQHPSGPVRDMATEAVAEIRRLRAQVAGHAERIAAQAELLAKRAEKG